LSGAHVSVERGVFVSPPQPQLLRPDGGLAGLNTKRRRTRQRKHNAVSPGHGSFRLSWARSARTAPSRSALRAAWWARLGVCVCVICFFTRVARSARRGVVALGGPQHTRPPIHTRLSRDADSKATNQTKREIAPASSPSMVMSKNTVGFAARSACYGGGGRQWDRSSYELTEISLRFYILGDPVISPHPRATRPPPPPPPGNAMCGRGAL
jgi:hypothetical protein